MEFTVLEIHCCQGPSRLLVQAYSGYRAQSPLKAVFWNVKENNSVRVCAFCARVIRVKRPQRTKTLKISISMYDYFHEYFD